MTSAAAGPQWNCIRDACPEPVNNKDFAIVVSMAWRELDWYIAIEVTDDIILSAQSSSSHPYSGDCFELFFAGTALDFDEDFHDLVNAPRTSNQKAFLQLELAPEARDASLDYFPPYRTDLNLRNAIVINQRFIARTARRRSRWSAEARIPIEDFEDGVYRLIRGGGPLKIGLDYLDYDKRLAKPDSRVDRFGFRPDNAFLAAEEDQVNVPSRMRPLTFGR